MTTPAPTESEHDVVIAGGGPTGMTLAAELALAGVDVAVVERRTGQELIGVRAGGLHSRTIEVFDQRGVAERFLSQGQVVGTAGFAMTRFDIGHLPTRHPYLLGLWQHHIERILAEWVAELGVPVYRGRDVTGFTQDDTGVDVALSDGGRIRAAYLAGCDGGRSLVRKTAGIGFPGWDPSGSNLIAVVEMAEEPEWGVRRDADGLHGIGRLEYEVHDDEVVYPDAGPIRVMITEPRLGPRTEPTLGDLSAALTTVYGTDFGVHSPISISRFTDASRQAASYRAGRVLLAGDAAHVHAPTGGQGLNLGVQDAMNLGWKLARVVGGHCPDSLLDTYHAERHPVGARVLHNTMAQSALMRADPRIEAARDIVAGLLDVAEARDRIAGMVTGLDVHYDLGSGHPLPGRRMPDLDLVTADGPARVYSLLRRARGVLLDLGAPGRYDLGGWADRVNLVEASYGGAWELPVLGAVEPVDAVLIRPDGHVAWVASPPDAKPDDALARWFGPGRV